MIFSPAVLSLILSSLISAIMLLIASVSAVSILKHWDIGSGSDRQLKLERRTYLVSTILNLILFFQIPSLFLFIAAAENLTAQIPGAMCGFGVFHANSYGFPALALQTLFSVGCSVWLLINLLDTQCFDFPLIRLKYAMLLLLAPIGVLAAILMMIFFYNLNPEVITSCCGSLFSSRPEIKISPFFTLPVREIMWSAGVSGASVIILSVVSCRMRWAGYALFVFSPFNLVAGLLAVISAVSPYLYELPTHHCPFCLLKSEYNYIGYLLYASIFVATVTSLTSGIISSIRKSPSVLSISGRFIKKTSAATVISEIIFMVLAVMIIAKSNLVMQ